MTDPVEPKLPNPRPALQHPPLMDHSFAALGWLQRAGQAVGSNRFPEALTRARFYLDKAEAHAHTPGEDAVMRGMRDSVDYLIEANAQARSLLARGCEDMRVAEVAEFIELIEGEKNFPEV